MLITEPVDGLKVNDAETFEPELPKTFAATGVGAGAALLLKLNIPDGALGCDGAGWTLLFVDPNENMLPTAGFAPPPKSPVELLANMLLPLDAV